MMNQAALAPGFPAPPIEAAQTFRAALQALSRPGTVHRAVFSTPPTGLSAAAAALALTLFDHETPVWLAPELASEEVLAWLRFHTGAPKAVRANAHFAIGSWAALAPATDFAVGTADYPDRSATLIVEVPALGEAHRLTGPGIREMACLTHPEPGFARANAALFPLGLDLYLTAGDLFAAIPRTTRVEG